jgi:tricorn protease
MGGLDFNFVVNRATRIYALALRKDLPHPFPPRNDEVGGKDEKKEKEKLEKSKWSFDKMAKAKPVRIDFAGLSGRVATVPVGSANYAGLRVTGTHLVWLRRGPWFHGREEIEATLEAYSIKERKVSMLAEKVRGFAMSRDGARLLALVDKAHQLIEIGKGEKPSEEPKKVAVDGLRVMVDPKQEWTTAFDEVWRRFRDYFYVENMHGHDWAALKKQYRPLLAHVAHRSDLNYLLGEMIAELNVSHAYVGGGDENPPARPVLALPGARFELDRRAGRYRIREIFSGHNQEENYRSPLTEVGIKAKAGDYLLAINGNQLRSSDNPYRLLRLPAGKPVELLLNRRPLLQGAWRVIYQPVKSERDLLYLAWVQKNREKVSRATGGRVGYLHIPDMMSVGIREFIKWFFNQTRREGLIVDVRSNGGGHVSELIIERLRRRLLMTGFGRHYDDIYTYPNNLLHGPMVCLINETSASDGDIFPHAFRQAGLGPLIGKRTWGGVIGITGHGPLIDGGQVYVPQFSTNDPRGRYIIEGEGVAPDIEVDNHPASILKGEDRQLDRAIQEIQKQLKKKPMRLPRRPPPPKKNGP